jgi:hypothetical protein
VQAARALLECVDPAFDHANVSNGLASGQGLLYRLRDAPLPVPPESSGGRAHSPDGGVADKRLLVVEEEFGQQLRLMNGRESTLSSVPRTAWDAKTLNSMTKGEPLAVTDPHVGLIAQIAGEELESTAGATEYTNGFFNRFLFVYVRRTKSLPFADPLPESEIAPIVRRVAMIFALLDGARTIQPEHLTAALAVRRYSSDSTRFLFRQSPGLSALATRLLDALSGAGAPGLDRTALWKASGSHNRTAGEMNKALEEIRTPQGSPMSRKQRTPQGAPVTSGAPVL